MADELTDTEPPIPSLGSRCVDWCESMAQSAVVPRTVQLAGWFALCERDGSHSVGDFLAAQCHQGKRPNHCAATQSAAAFQCRLPGEVIPHGYRAAAKELMRDAIAGGTWKPKALVLSGAWLPRRGDLAIYDRSKPGRPETAWQGHVDRVTKLVAEGYENIGANEGPQGQWRRQVTRFDHEPLMGFIEYPGPVGFIPKEFREHILALSALTLEQSEAKWWEDREA